MAEIRGFMSRITAPIYWPWAGMNDQRAAVTETIEPMEGMRPLKYDLVIDRA